MSTIGRIAVRWSRAVEGTIKTVTVSKEADGWYVCCCCADVPTEPLPRTAQETGIDVGLTVFLITADGDVVENPHHHRKAERALKKAQQRVSCRKKGSNRRQKAAAQCGKQQQHVRRQRAAFHHKAARALVPAYDTISVAAIQPANRSRRPVPIRDGNGGYLHNGARAKAGLNTSIHDAAWGHFLSILAFKAACAGKRVEVVSPAYTAQDCSGCGERIQKRLSVRTHLCTNCGLILDRDEHAARNLHWRGQRLRGLPALAGGMNREPVGL